MSEMELKTDMEVEEFTDELRDEALDRAEGLGLVHCWFSHSHSLSLPVANR